MSHPDNHRPSSLERNPPLSALDSFNISLRDTLNLLDDRHTTPTTQIIELGGIQFGKFGDSVFSCFLTHEYGRISGAMEFADPSDASSPLHLQRDPHKIQWQLRNGHVRTNREVLSLLNRNWPTMIPNDELAMYAALDDPLDSDILSCLQTAMLPHASFVTHERAYEYRLQRMDEANAMLTETLRLHRVDTQGFTKIDATIDIPYAISGVPSILTCTIRSDELGTTRLSAYYIHPETRERTDISVSSEESVLAEFRHLIALMLDEKMLDASSL